MTAINLLKIEDSSIKAMMADPRVIALVPCLASAKQQLDGIVAGGKECLRCKKEKAQIAENAMRNAVNCIASLRGTTLSALKALLNARQLRVYVKKGGRRTSQTM